MKLIAIVLLGAVGIALALTEVPVQVAVDKKQLSTSMPEGMGAVVPIIQFINVVVLGLDLDNQLRNSSGIVMTPAKPSIDVDNKGMDSDQQHDSPVYQLSEDLNDRGMGSDREPDAIPYRNSADSDDKSMGSDQQHDAPHGMSPDLDGSDMGPPTPWYRHHQVPSHIVQPGDSDNRGSRAKWSRHQKIPFGIPYRAPEGSPPTIW